jgi:glycosyltransferase involved in cell wall biosynthesis
MIYYDVTDLLHYFETRSQVSGIQRVTVAIIRELLSLAQSEGKAEKLMLLARHPRDKRLVATDAGFFQRKEISGEAFCAHFGVTRKSQPEELEAYLKGKYRRKWQRAFHGRRLTFKNWLSGGKTFRSKGLNVRRIDHSGDAKAEWRPVEFNPGDVIYISEVTWHRLDHLRDLGRLRDERHCKIVHLIYDALPVKRPEYFPKGLSFAFEDWLVLLNQVADAIVTNAEVTRDDLVSFAKDARLPPFRDVRIAPLAHEFLSVEHDGPKLGRNALYAKISPNVLQAARLPYALCVGTQEIRKNNWGVAQVWEKLRQKHGYALPRLVFAGRRGWLNDDFDALLKRTNHLNGAIVTIDNASDDDIAYLYSNCAFSVFPSFAEGWGLPIGESLWFGKPVITSKLSAMPGVAGGFADYADPYDLSTLEAAVEKMLDPAYREARAREIASKKLRRWSEVAETIWLNLHSV